jgi:hypothetical protein
LSVWHSVILEPTTTEPAHSKPWPKAGCNCKACEYARKQIEAYGLTNPFVRVNIFGEDLADMPKPLNYSSRPRTMDAAKLKSRQVFRTR